MAPSQPHRGTPGGTHPLVTDTGSVPPASLTPCVIVQIQDHCSMRRIWPLTQTLSSIASREATLELLLPCHPSACLIVGESPLPPSFRDTPIAKPTVRALTFAEARYLRRMANMLETAIGRPNVVLATCPDRSA